MATSLTRNTTSGAHDTSWVEGLAVERMDAEMIRCGVMIMGKGTYESFGADLPLGKALLIVMTHDQRLLTKKQDGLIFTDKNPKDVLTMIQEMGYQDALLAGGETLNSAFLKEKLISEMRIIMEPLVIGHGKSLFNIDGVLQEATLTNVEKLDKGVVELTYQLIDN